jgi:hypothetical protein
MLGVRSADKKGGKGVGIVVVLDSTPLAYMVQRRTYIA